MSDLEAVPNPVIHSCQILDPGRDVRRIEIVSEGLKSGGRWATAARRSSTRIEPGPRARVHRGPGQSASAHRPTGLERMEANPLEVVDSPDLPPLWQVFGGHRARWALGTCRSSRSRSRRRTPRCTSDRSSSCWRTAATDAAAELAGTDASMASRSHVMFLARGKAGPFRVETEPMPGADGMLAVRIVMHDEGTVDRHHHGGVVPVQFSVG